MRARQKAFKGPGTQSRRKFRPQGFWVLCATVEKSGCDGRMAWSDEINFFQCSGMFVDLGRVIEATRKDHGFAQLIG